MKKYFYQLNENQKGPYSLDELKNQKINKKTFIWFEGLSDWKEAASIDELKSLFVSSPPPIKKQLQKKEELKPINNNIAENDNVIKIKKKRSIASKILIIGGIIVGGLLTIIIGFIIISIINNSGSGSGGGGTSHPTTQDLERDYPQNYIEASGTYRETLIGRNVKISGYVENNATYTDYKDVKIEVKFYSKTKAVVSSKNYVIYDFYPKGSYKEFEIKVDFPKSARTCGWEAIDATVY